MFGAGITKPPSRTSNNRRVSQKTGEEPVLVHTGEFENRIYLSEWGIGFLITGIVDSLLRKKRTMVAYQNEAFDVLYP
jgi:hypothetical protein